jgi:hypothetical protein
MAGLTTMQQKSLMPEFYAAVHRLARNLGLADDKLGMLYTILKDAEWNAHEANIIAGSPDEARSRPSFPEPSMFSDAATRATIVRYQIDNSRYVAHQEFIAQIRAAIVIALGVDLVKILDRNNFGFTHFSIRALLDCIHSELGPLNGDEIAIVKARCAAPISASSFGQHILYLNEQYALLKAAGYDVQEADKMQNLKTSLQHHGPLLEVIADYKKSTPHVGDQRFEDAAAAIYHQRPNWNAQVTLGAAPLTSAYSFSSIGSQVTTTAASAGVDGSAPLRDHYLESAIQQRVAFLVQRPSPRGAAPAPAPAPAPANNPRPARAPRNPAQFCFRHGPGHLGTDCWEMNRGPRSARYTDLMREAREDIILPDMAGVSVDSRTLRR